MAVKTFSTMVEFKKMIEPLITKAIDGASKKILDKLRDYIMEEYYDKYSPMVYSRTMQFYDSAKSMLLSPTSAQIYMDADSMNYGSYWDGETQLYMADAGFHGHASIFREGFFWKSFIEWCDENAVKILKEELKKQGLNIR